MGRRKDKTDHVGDKSARPHGADASGRPKRQPIRDLEVVEEIELTEPGSALDEQLRQEQSKALIDLVIAHRRRHPESA
jgi:hypothetical protein